MNKTINEIFDYFPGNHALTEEIIYNQQSISNEEKIPIFSGSSDNFIPIAFIKLNAKNKKNENVKYFDCPCLILTKDGSAGLLTYKEKGTFTLNHHACVLKLKDRYIGKVDVEWFSFHYRNSFLQYVTSKSDNRVFSTDWFDRIKFYIPDNYKYQERIKLKKKYLIQILQHIRVYKKEILKNYSGKYIIDFKKSKNLIKLSETVYFKGGNSGLTKEFIYNNQPINEDEKLKIYSGATEQSNFLGYISKYAIIKTKNGQRPLKIFNPPCIIVSRKGKAGYMRFIKNETFTINDDAYVIYLKANWKNRLNLRWFSFQFQNLFLNLITSKSDNATFNKKYVEQQLVYIPDKPLQDKIANKLTLYDNLLGKLNFLDTNISSIIYSIIK